MHDFVLLLPGNSPCCVFIDHLAELACDTSSPGACKEEPLLSIIAIIAIIIIIILSLKFQQSIFPKSSSSHFFSARC